MTPKIRIQNMVATASFKQTFDLNAIFMAFPDARAGAKREEVYEAVEKLAAILEESGVLLKEA